MLQLITTPKTTLGTKKIYNMEYRIENYSKWLVLSIEHCGYFFYIFFLRKIVGDW